MSTWSNKLTINYCSDKNLLIFSSSCPELKATLLLSLEDSSTAHHLSQVDQTKTMPQHRGFSHSFFTPEAPCFVGHPCCAKRAKCRASSSPAVTSQSFLGGKAIETTGACVLATTKLKVSAQVTWLTGDLLLSPSAAQHQDAVCSGSPVLFVKAFNSIKCHVAFPFYLRTAWKKRSWIRCDDEFIVLPILLGLQEWQWY